MKPSVGITGYKLDLEVNTLADVYKENGFTSGPYTAMFGFLCNSRQLDLQKYSGPRNPAIVDLEGLISSVPKWAMPFIHFDTREPLRLKDDVIYLLFLIRQYENHTCQGLQLNVEWPRPKDIDAISEFDPGLEFVLQIEDKPYLDMKYLAYRAKEYHGLVDYCLIDPSRGAGKDFEVERAVELMHLCQESLPDAVIGIAGGFDGTNVEARIKTIKQCYDKPFFIDAEGKLRDRQCLNIGKCKDYIQNSAKALHVCKDNR